MKKRWSVWKKGVVVCLVVCVVMCMCASVNERKKRKASAKKCHLPDMFGVFSVGVGDGVNGMEWERE